MVEELKQFKDDLDTAEDPKEVLAILEKLQNATVTLELLKTSQLGLSVGNLKKRFATNKKVVDVSKKLVTDWKNACLPAGGTPKAAAKTATKKVEEKEVKKEETTPTNDKKRKLSNTNIEEVKKKPAASPSSALKGGETDRDRARICLTEALGETEDGDTWEPADAATTIENELLTIFGSASKDYKAKLRSLLFNLKKNTSLRRDVLNGSVTIDRLCRMTSAEMASEEEQKRRRDTEKWHMEAATLSKPEASTDQFLCGKCKNRKCTYYQLQTRSADEPMTTFVTCTVCNNRWKFC